MNPAWKKSDGDADWYDEVCQRLEYLRHNAGKYADPDEVIPEEQFFEDVKESVGQLRQQANFPSIPSPEVWLGPEGDIGLTWDIGERSFDLIFGENRFLARLTTGLKQEVIEPSAVPSVLAKLAA